MVVGLVDLAGSADQVVLEDSRKEGSVRVVQVGSLGQEEDTSLAERHMA